MDEFQDQMFEIFLYETNGFLKQLEEILLQAETQPQELRRSVNEIFRIMHTIKSSSAMVGLSNMSVLAHRMEDLFQYLRDFKSAPLNTGEVADLLLQCVDYMKRAVTMEAGEDPPDDLLEQISAHIGALKAGLAAPEASFQLLVKFRPTCDVATLRAFELIAQVSQIARPVAVIPAEGSDNEEQLLRNEGLKLTFALDQDAEAIKTMISRKSYVLSVGEAGEDAAAKAAAEELAFRERRRDSSRRGEGLIGVETRKLDQLISLSGETVIASMEAIHCFHEEQQQIGETLERLHQLIMNVQESALSLRMVTLGDTFHSLKRSLRDMTRELDREIEFMITGEDNLIDKEVVQYLSSPLMHVAKNAIEHGIESRQERLKAGKEEAGHIYLSAELSGQTIEISIRDDGKGIDPQKILDYAVGRELVTPEQAAGLSLDEVYSLLLIPGFSTKQEISEYSGRGVGLDVVNENLRKINGRLQIRSNPPNGTEFILKVPMTLARMDVFIAEIAGERYTVPIDVVKEAFHPLPETLQMINGRASVLFHNICYPVYALDGKERPLQDYTKGILILTDTGTMSYALFADEITDRRNVVVKPVPALLKSVPGLMGCTVLGDGQVSLIIDVVTFPARIGKR